MSERKKLRKQKGREERRSLIERMKSSPLGVFMRDNGRFGHQARARRLEAERHIIEAEYNAVKDIPQDELTSAQRWTIKKYEDWWKR